MKTEQVNATRWRTTIYLPSGAAIMIEGPDREKTRADATEIFKRVMGIEECQQ